MDEHYSKRKEIIPEFTKCETCEITIKTKDWNSHRSGKKHKQRDQAKVLGDGFGAGKPAASWGDEANAAAAVTSSPPQRHVSAASPNGGNDGWGVSDGRGGSGAECRYCHQEGHMIRDCPVKAARGGGVGGGDNGCFNCGKPGHRKTECTEPRAIKCNNCQQFGHMSRECPSKPEGGANPTQTCFNCGETGHRKSECTNERKMQCRNCDEWGHSSKECPQPFDRAKARARTKCNKCQQVGHYERECTNEAAPKEDLDDWAGVGVDVGDGGATWDDGGAAAAPAGGVIGEWGS